MVLVPGGKDYLPGFVRRHCGAHVPCVYYAAVAKAAQFEVRVADFLIFVSEQWLLVSLLLALVYVFLLLEHLKAGKQLSVHEVTRLLNGGEALVVDLRDAKDYQAGHINGAIHVPFRELAERAAAELDPERTVILVDKLGQQAASAGRQLRRAGFRVSRLRGGMAEWQAQSMPVVS